MENVADGNATPDEAKSSYNNRASAFDIVYMEKQADFSYKPMKPVNDAKLYLEDFPKLTTSSVGIKLKKISGLRR